MTPRIPIKRKVAADSPYRNSCPACHAEPLYNCVSKAGKRCYMHRERSAPVISAPLPDLREWWRSMKIYEGKYPLPRPEGLSVP